MIPGKKLEDVQLLRGVSVLFVLCYHLDAPSIPNGFLGVDIFLVISGYFCAQLLVDRTPGEFYLRRFTRLFPEFIIVCGLSVIASALILGSYDFLRQLNHLILSVFLLYNAYLSLGNGYFQTTDYYIFHHFWSIVLEAQFYAIAPFLASRLQQPVQRLKLVTFLVLSLSLLIALIHLKFDSEFLNSTNIYFYNLPTRLWQFLLGGLAFHYASKEIRYGKIALVFNCRITKFIIFLSIFVTVIFAYISPTQKSYLNGHPALISIVISVLTALFLVSKAKLELQNKFCIFRKALIFFGDRSYSLYLVHFPVITLFSYRPFASNSFDSLSLSEIVALTILSISLAIIIDWFAKKLSLRDSRKKLFTIVGLFCICLLTSIFINSRVWNKEETALFMSIADRGSYRCGWGFRHLHPREDWCTVGAQLKVTQDKRILLFGNSHANSIKESFASVLNESGYSVSLMHSNDSLTSTTLSEYEINLLVEKVRKNFSIVFVHYDNRYNDKEFVRRLVYFIQKLESNNVFVGLLGPVPSYFDSVPKILWHYYLQSSSMAKVISLNLVDLTAWDYLSQILDETSITVYDTREYLCPDSSCKLSNGDGNAFYHDSNHLTLTGARVLEPIFRLFALSVNARFAQVNK